jgi:hypothetical protein
MILYLPVIVLKLKESPLNPQGGTLKSISSYPPLGGQGGKIPPHCMRSRVRPMVYDIFYVANIVKNKTGTKLMIPVLFLPENQSKDFRIPLIYS